MKIWYDTETCGFVGMPVLIQYRTEDDHEIKLYEFWRNPIRRTLELIEWLMENELIGFNLAFDHFQLCKIYTIFQAYVNADAVHDGNFKVRNERMAQWPEDHIEEIAKFELAGMDGPCLKPKAACDLMLLARKGKWQITMERSDIRVKRIPTVLAWDVAKELERRILFDTILFDKQKNKNAPRWAVRDIVSDKGEVDKNFKDIVLKFKASGGLKALAVAACDFLPQDVISFQDVNVDKCFLPDEIEYAPFADAVWHKFLRHTKWKDKRKNPKPWPKVIKYHIDHWAYNEKARTYAKNDIVMTYSLWVAFEKPEPGDVDSELACCVAAVRWRGYALDIPGIEELLKMKQEEMKAAPIVASRVRKYLTEAMSPEEKMVLNIVKTGKVVLIEIAKGETYKGTEVAKRAQEVLNARFAVDEIKLYRKLLIAQKLHFSVKVIGALSSRMSGANKLNPQGVKRDKHIRSKFTFARPPLVGYGGDFDAFEAGIADAIYQDPKLHEELKSGLKIHTIFAGVLFPKAAPEEIEASKGSADGPDMYDFGKRGVFSQIYMGNWTTLVKKLGIAEDIAKAAADLWRRKYPGIAKAQQRIIDLYSSMRQPAGIGTRIIWNDPPDYVASLLGHKRYFTLENRICKELYDLANNPLKKWKSVEGKVIRRERAQTVGGAVMSALFACAFNIQSTVTRQAGNHEIQSTGAEINKDAQWTIWKIQPCGINEWRVQPGNIHDEVMCPTHPDYAEEVIKVVNATVEKHRAIIPLINLEFKPMNTWADK